MGWAGKEMHFVCCVILAQDIVDDFLLNYIVDERLQAGLILGLHPANERQRYFVKLSLIGWAQT